MVHGIDTIHQWINWEFEEKDQKIKRLASIDRKGPNFLTNEEIASERSWLVKSISEERLDRIIHKILISKKPSSMMKAIETTKQKLSDLVEQIKKNDLQGAKSTLESLPNDVRHMFYWAVWVYHGAPEEDRFGEKKLNEQISLLSEIKSPLLHFKGKTLCKQMLYLYEMLYKEQQNLLLQSGRITEKEDVAHRKEKIHTDSRYLYQWRGAHPKEDGTRFQVFAPHARQASLILTAFGKEEHRILMERKNFGLFETHTPHAFPGRTYRYLIEDCLGRWNYRTDPFSFSVRNQEHAVESVVIDTESFLWNDAAWIEERSHKSVLHEPLSIYEVHVAFWKKQKGRTLSFRELAYSLVDYQKKIPFTHVQLYGVLDHKNDGSWGYQTDHFFAPNRRLGNADDFKFLVDLCHQHKIGVIIDWIPAHYKHEHDGDFSQSLHDYDGTHLFGSRPSCWGTILFDFNKDETKRLLLASALYWFEEMHVDGLRVDAVGPMIYRKKENQSSAIQFLKDLNSLVHEQYPGCVMIAEETEGFPQTTKPVIEGGLGFDMKLGIHMQHRMRNYFKTPYDQRGWEEHHYGKLLRNLDEIREDDQWMISHSHDDAAAGESHCHSTIYNSIPTLDTWRKFADMRLFHAWNLLTPGFGHGIHMGDEIGQKSPWNERLYAFEGAVEWNLLDHDPDSSLHRGLQECVGDLNRLYRSKPAFWKHGRGFQLISHYATNQVIGFHRFDYLGQRIAVLFNFSPTGYENYDFPLTPLCEDPDLSWIKEAKEIFNTDGVQYGGTGKFGNTWAFIVRDHLGTPTHFRFSFPPLSAVVFEETWSYTNREK